MVPSWPKLRSGYDEDPWVTVTPAVEVVSSPLAPVSGSPELLIVSSRLIVLPGAMVMRLAPAQPTHVQVDDLLYNHGIVDSLPLPENAKPVDIGRSVSPFAETLRTLIADKRRMR